VCPQGLDTTRPAAPGARALPGRVRRGWLWWVSRWSLPLYRLRLGWVVGHRFMLITHRGRRFFHWPWPPSNEDLRRLARSLGGVAFRPGVTSGPRGATETLDRLKVRPSGRDSSGRLVNGGE
jgi:hypothetical protein